MGNDASKGTQGGTTVDVVFERKVAQAGAALRGTIKVNIGSDGSKLLKDYPLGLVIEAQVFGSESAFWALNMKHGPGARKGLVPQPNKREQATILCDIKQQLQQLDATRVSQHNVKIDCPFSIPLPENLPSSVLYNGEFMSQLSISYRFNANLVGIKPSAAGGLPEGTVVFGRTEDVIIRARDPPAKQGISQEQTGQTKGALG